ncbi:MAG: type II toxin-antitoxin system RelB/DinJ family antitoxin [Treponema sp.]|nr:type II toxin-antitoxin system RelB/DinJ family antitoxin [Treponema sp.]MBQ2551918.1 type II toxin-antitoxin system RelB/DinJ family antitoxin [Treponema sp.]MBQ4235542.1 type II toxin-antitoxin system RelB/DinJ family antitoxin [Treponema sp.]MBQ5384975.1 type II toxin-antitoxin system RelB/DinJ family antitoxin [Treponema sp.]
MSGISIKTDNETKIEFTKFCDKVGITVSAAINLFMKATIRENRIPFEIRAERERDRDCDRILKEFESTPNVAGFGATEELFDDD